MEPSAAGRWAPSAVQRSNGMLPRSSSSLCLLHTGCHWARGQRGRVRRDGQRRPGADQHHLGALVSTKLLCQRRPCTCSAPVQHAAAWPVCTGAECSALRRGTQMRNVLHFVAHVLQKKPPKICVAADPARAAHLSSMPPRGPSAAGQKAARRPAASRRGISAIMRRGPFAPSRVAW